MTRIQHTPMDRVITFTLSGVNYTFDPNRMFTPKGIDNTLKAYGPYSQAAAQEVSAFASQLLSVYDFQNQKTVIGLHNNGPFYSALE